MHFQPASNYVIAEDTCRLQKSGVLLKMMITVPCNFEAESQDVFWPPAHQVEQRSDGSCCQYWGKHSNNYHVIYQTTNNYQITTSGIYSALSFGQKHFQKQDRFQKFLCSNLLPGKETQDNQEAPTHKSPARTKLGISCDKETSRLRLNI